MKNIIKELLFNFVGSFLYIIFPVLIKPRKNSIYVINYHSTYPEFNNNFIKQIKFFKKNFKIIDEKSLLTKKKFFNSKKPKLLITFDDAHISNLYILKILKKFKIKCIFFVPYLFVSRKREKNIFKENRITLKNFEILSNREKDIKNNYSSLSLSFKDLKKILAQKHSIGVHGYSHIRLSNNLSNKTMVREIKTSKKLFEKRLNIKINSFCWTFGDKKSFSKKAANLIKKNYTLSFMTCCKPFNFNMNFLQIHRFNIENNFSLKRIAFILSGIYELFYYWKRKYVNNITK